MDKLKILIETYLEYQKERERFDNKLGSFTGKEDLIFNKLKQETHSIEIMIEKEMKLELKTEKLYTDYLSNIKGIKVINSAYLIGLLCKEREAKVWGDKRDSLPAYAKVLKEEKDYSIVRYPPVMQVARHASSIWKYCGIIPGSKLTKGSQINYNPLLKSIMFRVFTRLLQAKGEYYRLYKVFKRGYEERCPEPDKGTKKLKVHLGVKNMVMRVFMYNLFVMYKHFNNLPVEKPYVHILGHEFIKPFVDMPELEYLNIPKLC